MTTTHTPGPWEANVDRSPDGDYRPVDFWEVLKPNPLDKGHDDANREVICHLGTGDQAEANASLIAAAPELLAALIDLLPHAERNIADLNSKMVGTLYLAINEEKIRRAEAAIAKAKGID